MRSLRYLFLFLCLGCQATTWFVSPSGSGTNGTIGSPMGLSNALSGYSYVTNGDMVYLRGGTYSGCFASYLNAPSNNPVIVIPYQGERAILQGDGSAANIVLDIEGSGVWFWGLEISSVTATNRTANTCAGADFNPSYPGSNNKLINCIIHDTGSPIFMALQSTNAEVCGCIVYDNGWEGTNGGDRGHGHGVYAQNVDGIKVVRDSIFCDGYGEGMQLYTGSLIVQGFDVFGNAVFDNGVLSTNGLLPNVLYEAGGQISLGRNNFYSNSVFQSQSKNTGMQCGYGSSDRNMDMVVTNNYFANGGPALFNFTNMIFSGNTVANGGNGVVTVDMIPGEQSQIYSHNSYYRIPAPYGPDFGTNLYVYLNETNFPSQSWQALGRDTDSLFSITLPQTNIYFIRQNPYDKTRGLIVVFNWQTNDNVNVDISSVVAVGAPYKIRNAQDYFGPVVKSDTYTGGNISLPMTNLTVAVPVGASSPAAIGPNFNVFILTQSAGSMPFAASGVSMQGVKINQ